MSEVMSDPGFVPAEEVVAPVEEAEPSWTGPSPEEWSAVMGYVQAQQQREYEAQQQGGEEPPAIDPFADDFGNQLGAYIQQAVQQAISPYAQWQQQQQENEGREQLLDVVADDVAQNGEFLLGTEKASPFIINAAREMYPQFAQRMGEGDSAAEAAIRQAAKEWREYEAQVGQSYYDRKMNQLTNIAGAPREPGVGSFPAGQLQQGARTVEELISKYAG